MSQEAVLGGGKEKLREGLRAREVIRLEQAPHYQLYHGIFSRPIRRANTCPIPLRFLSWNCRGLGNGDTSNSLRRLCKNKQPHCLFLMETKLGKDKFGRLGQRLGFKIQFLWRPKEQSVAWLFYGQMMLISGWCGRGSV